MTPVFLSDSVWLHFGTSSVTTGAATNADSTPTVTIAEDGVDLVYAPVVTNVTTGLYSVQIDATSGNGFEAGKRYSVYVVATVGAITGRDGIGEFEILGTDMNTALDAAITSRMATYVQPTGFLTAVFPTTVASTTNITDGTIGTVTNRVTANTDQLAGQTVSAAAGVTFPASVASPTNITAGTITTTTNLTNLPAITADWLTAAGTAADFGTELGTAVWATATRLLTAGTNIVLAKGVGVTGFNDIAATDIVSGGSIITSGGLASVDVRKLNSTTVTGTGNLAGPPWGPA